MWGKGKERWGRNVFIGFAVAVVCWTGLFLASAFLTVYDDHQNLAGASLRLKREVKREQRDKFNVSRESSEQWRSKISVLQASCAEQRGINTALERQNKDQQNTINGCINQALKLLTPPKPTVTTLYIGSVISPGQLSVPGLFSVSWLLLTNTPISPVDIEVDCGGVLIQRANISILTKTGSSVSGGSFGNLPAPTYHQEISTPAWNPNTPILATIYVASSRINGCSFTEK